MRLRPVPPMLTGIVHTALQVCDGTEYRVEGPCTFCGGTPSGYDVRTKRFAILCDEEGDHPVAVSLHRAYCRSCGRIILPDEPFYPGTRMGSPVVDLCRALAETMPCGRVATRLEQMGVRVDRWSVRSYTRKQIAPLPMVAVFGMMIPVSIISLSALAGSGGDTGPASGEDILTACRFPSRHVPDPK
nr:hypothetical protein [uncultured Methanoregula sp.]